MVNTARNPMAYSIGVLNVMAPHGKIQLKILIPRNDHGCHCEVGVRIHIHTNRKHVVGPNDEAKAADGHHRIRHT